LPAFRLREMLVRMTKPIARLASVLNSLRLCSLAFLALVGGQAAAADKPNVICIMADD
jgi:hypothetical protein